MTKLDKSVLQEFLKVNILEDASSLGLFRAERRLARSSGSGLNIQYGWMNLRYTYMSVLVQQCYFQIYGKGEANLPTNK